MERSAWMYMLHNPEAVHWIEPDDANSRVYPMQVQCQSLLNTTDGKKPARILIR
jgi:hypothetical protein